MGDVLVTAAVALILFCPHVVGGEAAASAHLSVPRAQLAGASINTPGGHQLALFAGGYDANGNDSDTVDVYDGAKDEWSVHHLSTGRGVLEGCSSGSLAFFAGGKHSHANRTDVVDVYNATEQRWTVERLSVARSMIACTSLGPWVFFAGGELSSDEDSDHVDVYHIETGQWKLLHLSVPRKKLGAAVAGDYAIFAGGYLSGRGSLTTIDMLDVRTMDWRQHDHELSTPRFRLEAASVGSLALFISGQGCAWTCLVSDVYDASTDTWRVVNTTSGRYEFSAITVADRVVVGGGKMPRQAGSPASIDVFDATKVDWANSTIDMLSIPRFFLAGAAVRDQLVLFAGGVSPDGVSDVVDRFDFSTSGSSPVPKWTAPKPDPSKKLGGYTQLPNVTLVEVCHGNEAVGTYNHAAMLDFFDGVFLLAWKNGPFNEDKDGQRVLFSQSTDGKAWSSTDGNNVLFPNMSASKFPSAMFVGPPIHINGRRYVGASPGIPTGAAAGAQFCLWPDPLDPRNCGPPGKKQTNGLLMMREVKAGLKNFGDIFWVSTPPSHWDDATKLFGIKMLKDMDAQTQADIGTLSYKMPTLPCGPTNVTLKCEACLSGCQNWDDNKKNEVGNERTHYVVSPTQDVILYRGPDPVLLASVRDMNVGGGSWGKTVTTDIPNDESNINTGPLPGGMIYLLNNPVYRPDYSGKDDLELKFRDPVTIATSKDGFTFDTCWAVMSCTNLSATSGCSPRYQGGGKNPGPSYPQGMAVIGAGEQVNGFYVVATNNKEDVWLAKFPFNDVVPHQEGW